MLSIDKSILWDGGEAQERMKEYGKIAEELHIIVYTAPGFNEKKISENVWIYPTNTVFKLFYFFNAYRIGKRLVRSRPDLETRKVGSWAWLITSQDAFTNIVAVILKKKFGIPFQAQIHTDFLSPYFKKESWKNYIRYLLYSWSVKKADCTRVVSERIKKSLISIFHAPQSKVTVLPIFVDIEKIKKTPVTVDLHKKYPGYDFIILMASRLTREKNIETACRAMAGVSQKFPKTLLLIVGDGPQKKILKEKYENLVKSYFPKGSRTSKYSNIIFEDAVLYETLISYYKTADFFLLTSSYEGYGRTIIEALAAGLPVFSTNVGVAKEIIKDGETGIIFKEHNSKEIASGITEVLSGNKLGGMKLKTREFAKIFLLSSKEEYLKKMKEDFEKCNNSAN